MSEDACTFERFQKDCAYHWMEIIHDDGPHRHLRFKSKGSSAYWFELITWGSHLCISGDCGTYVFSRTQDMFRFFRPYPNDSDRNSINPSYWAEKVLAEDRDGVKRYSHKTFEGNVKRWLADMAPSAPDESDDAEAFAEYEAEVSKYAELCAEVEEDVLGYSDDGETSAISRAMDFEFKGCRPFTDFWEVDCREYTFRYLWCCYAIVWGIGVYDAHLANRTLAQAKILATRAGMAVAA